jgi:hypothetical protein
MNSGFAAFVFSKFFDGPASNSQVIKNLSGGIGIAIVNLKSGNQTHLNDQYPGVKVR